MVLQLALRSSTHFLEPVCQDSADGVVDLFLDSHDTSSAGETSREIHERFRHQLSSPNDDDNDDETSTTISSLAIVGQDRDLPDGRFRCDRVSQHRLSD